MQNIVLNKPYCFFPPFNGKILPKIINFFISAYLKREDGVVSVEFKGLDNLRRSISSGSGIVLAPNHCRPSDPPVMGLLSKKIGFPFYYMASWHLFMQGRIKELILRSFGAFSVYREGVDRLAVKTAVEIMIAGERPLVIFPEGHITRSNDLLHPFMEGISLMVKMADKERVKRSLSPVIVHPTAIRYKLLDDVTASLNTVLDEIEQKFFWRHRELPLKERVIKVGEALLALKELEYFNEVKSGSMTERIQLLTDLLLGRVESKWLNGKHHALLMENVNALRHAILEKMLDENLSEEETKACWDDLADIYLAVQLSCYPADYLGENPTMERLAETVERFEEDTTDKARIHGRWKAIVEIGDGIVPANIQGGKFNVVLQTKMSELLHGLETK
jgi:1-acyl-sn-glycerol-3-phosphate acyltransferase